MCNQIITALKGTKYPLKLIDSGVIILTWICLRGNRKRENSRWGEGIRIVKITHHKSWF